MKKPSDPPPNPPPEFLDRMQQLLPATEFEAFVAAFARPPHTGLRINTLKIAIEDFTSIAPFPLAPAGEWCPAAFLVKNGVRPGRHPYHDTGLYYLQEPSAMVAAATLQPEPGELVLDLAAAPGGKATHLAALLGETGETTASPLCRSVSKDSSVGDSLIVANDIHGGRVRLLAENLARWGAMNAVVTHDEPIRLATSFGPIFDRVLLDAPCSGEGMFRRQEDIDWSEAIVAACARRQTHILALAPQLVRPGGHLLYATCTFAPEENENVIAAFLATNPDFYLVEPSRYHGFSRGRPEWSNAPKEISGQLTRAIRLWPHQFPGEGHFIALLQRAETRLDDHPRQDRFSPTRLSALERNQWQDFARASLTVTIPEERLHVHNSRLYLLPSRMIDPGRVRLVRVGTCLGEFRTGYFRPAQDLALAMKAEDGVEPIRWRADDEALQRFLAGENLPINRPNGWVLVTVDGYGLSWAKCAGGRLKNHYPRHLRRPFSHP